MLLVETRRVHTSDDGSAHRHQPGDVYRADADRAREMSSRGVVDLLEDVDGISWQNVRGRVLTPLDGGSRYLSRATDGPRALQLTQYDPGSAAYRYHSAANVDGSGTSAFVRFGHTNPYSDLRQFDGSLNHRACVRLMEHADVVHVHMDYTTLQSAPPMGLQAWPRPDQLLIRHYHGSEPESFRDANGRPGDWPRIVERAFDDKAGAVHIGARLYHLRLSERMHWLPIPMPVADYRALRDELFVPMEQRPNQNFRIAHSSTNPRVKGTPAIQCAVDDLRAKGLKVELVLIMNKSHREALRLKATCDATFDSFWLGIQGSGLEGASMGQPVIAGDPSVRDEHIQHLGECPYTYAEDYEAVKPVIERMVLDSAWRAEEAMRVSAYTRHFHDYPAVGAKYWSIVEAERKYRQVSA